MNEQDLWRSATTLRQLGDLSARWLEGSLEYHPGYGANHPDPETGDLIPVLAALNRAGYWTDQSQPGSVDGGWQQRAFVTGIADDAIAELLMQSLGPTELVVIAFPPGVDITRGQVVVTREGDLENTWLGIAAGADELHHQYGSVLAPSALEEVLVAWELHIFDPHWGRNDRLWSALAEVASHAT